MRIVANPPVSRRSTDADTGIKTLRWSPGHAILEASTKALTEMMDSLVREHRAVVGRNPREAERLLGSFMKVQTQLQRSLKEWDESRARQQAFR